MKNELRTILAFIVTGFVCEKFPFTKIWDEKKNEYIPCSLKINNYGFNAYDYSRGSYLNGTKNTIYDFETKETLTVSYYGATFSGFEHSTNYHFNGIVNFNSVTIYDEEFKQYFKYSLI